MESLPTIKASQLRIMGIKRSKSLANRTKNCYKKSIEQPLKVPDFGARPINSPPSEKEKKKKRREDACWHNTVVFKSAR